MKSSFGSAPAAETPAPSATAESNDDSQLVDSDFFEGGFSGSIDKKILRPPVLALVHGVGPLAQAGFIPGSLVYNAETVLAEPKKAIMKREEGATITLLAGFQEYTETTTDEEYQAGVKARHFRKEQDARNAGLVTKKEARDRNDPTLRTYAPAFQLKVIIEGKPEHGFGLEFGGKTYALAALTLAKGNFWAGGVPIGNFINSQMIMKRPIQEFTFNLWTELKKWKGATNPSWVINAAKSQRNSPEFLQWIKDLGV
jgi:hypothetical protein